MTYKGYEAKIEYDSKEMIYVGTLSNCSDLVSFHSSNIRDLREKFRLAVDNMNCTTEIRTAECIRANSCEKCCK